MNPGGIRAGGVYIEIGADDSSLQGRLAATQTRLRTWVAQNQAQFSKASEGALAGGAEKPGFFGGSFRGTNLLGESGLRFAVAVQEARVAIKDVQIFSALARGDFEGMRKAAEELPFGLGEIVKTLSGPVDEAAKQVALRLSGLSGFAYDTSAAANAEKDQARATKAFNEGNKAIAEIEKALQKATLSAREYAAAEVAGMGLSADQAEKLLGLKLQLITADERRKLGAQQQALIARGESAVGQAMDQYAKATMSERDFIAYEVKQMGLAENHAQSLLNWKLAILEVTEKQALAEKRAHFDEQIGAMVEGIKNRVAEVRGTIDSLGLEEARAQDEIAKAVGAGTLSFQEAAEQVDRIKAAFAGLRAAQGAAATKKEGEALTESLRTPEEEAKAKIARYKELLALGVGAGGITEETYSRAVRKSLEDAAAAMPDAVKRTIGVRGTFNAMEAAGLGAGGVSDRIAAATEKTAKNTDKIAQVAASLGVNFN
jgi:ribosomal protein L13E